MGYYIYCKIIETDKFNRRVECGNKKCDYDLLTTDLHFCYFICCKCGRSNENPIHKNHHKKNKCSYDKKGNLPPIIVNEKKIT